MKQLLLFFCILIALGAGFSTNAQSLKFQRTIQVTDTIIDSQAKIAVSSDDAEQENQAIDALYDDDIDAGWQGAPEDRNILTAGMRFRNITIPKGAKIDSAYIIVYSHEGKTKDDVARITITADASDNAPTFREDSLITKRLRTTAKVLWEVKVAWGLWTPHRTPDLKAILQELVNRPGWKASNAMAFIFQGEDQGPSEVENAREWESFENIADPGDGGDGQNHPERRPELVIFYSSMSTSTHAVFAASVKALKVFPNPSKSGEITLELDATTASSIRLYHTNGQLLKTQPNDFGKQIRFQTGNLPAGMYYLQATQGQDVYVQKLVIKE